MDDRIPKPVRTVVRKLDFLALPNLGSLICGLIVLGFIGKYLMNAPMDRFVFDPDLFLGGEWWRLFAFPVQQGNDHPIWAIFYVLVTFFVFNSIEQAWGPGPLTVFTLFGYLSAIAGAFVLGGPISLWVYVLGNVNLAFGTLFPEMEFYIFFVLPVKAKWLAMLWGAMIFFEFATGGLIAKAFYLIVYSPYLIFFGPFLYKTVRQRIRTRENRNRIDKDMWR